jgi:hypothetical protein
MKYSKPLVRKMISGSRAIQSGVGSDPFGKVLLIVLDSKNPRMLSTTAAYEADE